ncbi:aryl-sulfate sulfotransferase [Mucilaginibacter sp. L3T2-6]|uniref:aryl-sulfate sulfotransferase n=1 Tax=Mucilaginibacter sp. L3T2-6 TaxID=3062491 RepID=UPI002675DF90|nr:aryl-sulfate sulfotransferase [Mucilaginibacter sp. L3T2-6]MDO3644725.1 aryl-sulfate sulfotransferase [Mucilaginibacter sp. L3T2-6]MDV6217239.1 aryl-sulfate sulfotransferase [Mucilaginibacter sp. L3T2-6]
MMQDKYPYEFLIRCIALLLVPIAFSGCEGSGKIILSEIHVGLHNNNELKIQLEVTTNTPADIYAEYWKEKDSTKKWSSTVARNTSKGRLIICNIFPETDYAYRIVAKNKNAATISKVYTFKTNALPMFLQDQFRADTIKSINPPGEFNDGLMLINKRYAPGVAYLVDRKAEIRWYHMVADLGFKVLHFTQDHTLLSIMGGNDEPTSYGHEILELNLSGDTVLHLKKGQNDLPANIHHEILKNDKGELVTIYVDKKVMDLRAIGGKDKDTVSGDGIIVMDKTGKKLWQWSVFNTLDPLKDKHLLKIKKDWMHANSLSYDRDGNFLLSFYNNGQIWKIDSKSGKVIWKFGKGGTIVKPAECDFTQTHAVHINQQGDLMFFDNGVEKQQSGVFAMKIDEQNQSSRIDMYIKLPKQIFNGRMGSAYMINDTCILVCCSKRHIIVLTDRKGTLLWTMETAVPTYRAEFIRGSELEPYLKP